MIFEEHFYLNYPVEEAWRFFTDFPGPIMVLPGVTQVDETSPRQYTGAIQVHIGPFNFLFRGDMNIVKIEPKTRQVVLSGSAHDHNLGSHFKAVAYTQTQPVGADRCRVNLEVQVGMGGVMGKLGVWLLKPKAHSIVQHYAELVSRELATRRNQAVPELAQVGY